MIAKFKAAVRSPLPAARVAAVKELALTPHDRTLARMIPLLNDPLPPK